MYLYYYLTYNKPKNLFVYVVSYHEKNVFKKSVCNVINPPRTVVVCRIGNGRCKRKQYIK